MKWFRDAPLQRKLTILTMSISGVALLLGCGAFAIYEQTEFRREMAVDLAIIADMFDDDVAPGLAANDSTAVAETLTTLSAHPHIVAACVYDHANRIVASYLRPEWKDRFQFPARTRTSQHFAADHLDTFQDVTLKGAFIGVVYIGSDLNELRAHLWRYVTVVSALLVICSLFVLVLSSRLQRIISRPIEDLAQTVATVAAEKNYALRAHKRSNDELGRLIDGFNEMLAQIQARDTALQNARGKLEERVDERTGELQTENAERKRAEAGLANSLSVLHATLESTVDGILVVDREGKLTTFNHAFAEIWGISPEILDRRDNELILEAQIGQMTDPEAFMAKVRALSAQPEADSFDILELKDGRTIERYSRPQRIDQAIVGRVLCFRDITERKRADQELRWKTALLEAQMNSSADGILMVDTQGKRILQNPLFGELWKIPREIVEDADTERQVRFVREQPKDPEAVVEKILHLYAHPAETSRDEIELKDGTVLDRYSSPVRGKDGMSLGRIWTVRDITARKQAEVDLRATHQELLAVSRQAGMAEIATGVLHNVGNVLNSVNVSATLVADQVRHSKAGNIAKLAELFAEHKADLAEFLTQDARGQIIPAYLGTLAESVATEKAALIEELEHLHKNVTHIKDIVAMQQSYARTSGVFETIAVPEMIEDALRMNTASLARHDIQLVRDFQARPVTTTDKHKVMQILINLVRNAKHACEATDRADKQIIVRLTGDDRAIQIAVIDNGVGIAPEYLARVFSHGFTTKKDGHGFGLHSGALAARELGGSLHAQSDGLGLGATFTLELPVKPADAAG